MLKPLKPDSDTSRVLHLLQLYGGRWLDYPYQRCRVMWHSRVAELRRRGHVIECRRVTDATGEADYQYRLVSEDARRDA